MTAAHVDEPDDREEDGADDGEEDVGGLSEKFGVEGFVLVRGGGVVVDGEEMALGHGVR